jgi:hypothetical protein
MELSVPLFQWISTKLICRPRTITSTDSNIMLTCKFVPFYSHISRYTIQLNSTDQLKDILLADVKVDINQMPPFDLFDKYGTHFVASMVLGGRSVMGSSTSKFGYHGTTSLEVVANASFSGLIGSASASNDTTLSKDVKTFEESSKIEVILIF